MKKLKTFPILTKLEQENVSQLFDDFKNAETIPFSYFKSILISKISVSSAKKK
jgi:hypothetical protein